MDYGFAGPGSKERAAMLKRVNSEWGPLMKGEEYNKELIGEFYIEMCKDIRTQRERVGGDWAVANVVYSREIRDKMRFVFCICLFIRMNLPTENFLVMSWSS